MKKIKNEFIFNKEIETMSDVDEWIKWLKKIPLSDLKEFFKLINSMRQEQLECKFKNCIYRI